jgi:2-polyprenyl-3-methyl-5-hydroxy-6-metoxy-1,4-benzoquinol methylase
MYELVKECPICLNENLRNNLVCKDYSVSKESFMLVLCDKCNTKITSPRPDQIEINKYYESPDYISHTNQGNNIINKLYKIIRSYTINSKIKLINNLTEKGKILDIGCGTGEFLIKCKKNKWEVIGIEPNINARNNNSLTKENLIYKDFNDLNTKKDFNIITLWHVLEHLYDPLEIMKKLRTLLKPGGYLIIAVPNHESLDAKYYKENWAAYDVPRHLYHFSKKSINSLAKKTKFKIEIIKPMYFDSFYVSLLSEKNIGTKFSLVKAFKKGLESNISAKKDNNFSSLIYILSKTKKDN